MPNYWQDKPANNNFIVSDEIVDLNFKISCKSLPLDHAWSLCAELVKIAPWLTETRHTAIHLVHGAESANGWMRPDDPQHAVLHLSRRARFTLRLHRDNIEQAQRLVDKTLDIDGHSLTIKPFKQQLLVPQSTVFSRYVLTSQDMDEDSFLQEVAPQIQSLGITIKKMMGGRQHPIMTPKGPLTTRSLMLSDLEKEESVALQQHGIGDKQLLGIGIFLPHKSIAPVKDLRDAIPPA